MTMTSDKAREVGEALIDAANNSDTLGMPCHVVYNDDLRAAICVLDSPTEDEVLHTVTPV